MIRILIAGNLGNYLITRESWELLFSIFFKKFYILQNIISQIMKQAQWQLSTGIGSFIYINFMFPSYNSPLSKKEKKTIKSFLMGNLSNVIILETVGYPCNTSIENFPIRTSNLSKYTWIFNQHSLTFYCIHPNKLNLYLYKTNL